MLDFIRFGYLDFDTIENATKVIRATNKHTFNGKKIRVEFGSEEAHRRGHPWEYNPERPKKGQKKGDSCNNNNDNNQQPAEQVQQENVPSSTENAPSKEKSAPKKLKGDKSKSEKPKRVSSAAALAAAPRQKASVQDFKGTKIVFGDD